MSLALLPGVSKLAGDLLSCPGMSIVSSFAQICTNPKRTASDHFIYLLPIASASKKYHPEKKACIQRGKWVLGGPHGAVKLRQCAKHLQSPASGLCTKIVWQVASSRSRFTVSTIAQRTATPAPGLVEGQRCYQHALAFVVSLDFAKVPAYSAVLQHKCRCTLDRSQKDTVLSFSTNAGAHWIVHRKTQSTSPHRSNAKLVCMGCSKRQAGLTDHSNFKAVFAQLLYRHPCLQMLCSRSCTHRLGRRNMGCVQLLRMLATLHWTDASNRAVSLLPYGCRRQASLNGLLCRLSFSCPPLCSWLARLLMTCKSNRRGPSRHGLLADGR